jgi:hypothetical protein
MVKLKIGIAMICASWIDTMFIGNNFPKLEKYASVSFIYMTGLLMAYALSTF